jgi:hypothetical protein
VQYSWNSFAEKAGVFSVKAMTRRNQAAKWQDENPRTAWFMND